MNNWVSYVFSGLMAVILSWSVSGCRFGNRVLDQPKPEDPLDKHTGYYETQSQKYELCATYTPASSPESGPQDKCVEQAPSLIPSDFTTVMTNPAFFYKETGATAGGIFNYAVGSLDDPHFAFHVDANYLLYDGGTYDPIQLSSGPDCFAIKGLLYEGNLAFAEGGPFKKDFGDLGTATVHGRIAMDYTDFWLFEGNCESALRVYADCLADLNNCPPGTPTRDDADILFKNLVGTVLTTNDIPFVTQLWSTVVYR